MLSTFKIFQFETCFKNEVHHLLVLPYDVTVEK